MKKALAAAIILSALLGALFGNSGAAHAASFDPTRVIDDAVFYNRYSMSVDQIQAFLNSKVPQCDTYGTQPSEFGGGTRAQYGSARGNPPPYVCIKDYWEHPTTHANNFSGSIPNGAQSAAQIIYNAAQQYGINPQVLIVTLQKESALITDTWPFASQYRTATGYGCPDSSGCDAQYFGFYNQVMNAARQFRLYANRPNDYNYVPGPGNFVRYSPDPNCGGSYLNIQNQATASLYNYTPYQPNAAAIAAGYGQGDSCSTHGIRNFWLFYNDWFNASDTIKNGVVMNTITQPDTTPARSQTVTYTFSFTNTLTHSVTLEAVGVVARQDNPFSGANKDFGWTGPVTLQPGASQQFTFSSTLSSTGMLYAWPAINYFGTYVHYNNWGTSMSVHQPNISLTSPLNSSAPNPVAGQTVTVSTTVKNNEDQPIRIDALGIPVRYYGTYNYDAAWVTPASSTLAPGATQTLSGTITFDKAGPYTLWVSWAQGGAYNSIIQPVAMSIPLPTPNFSLTYLETPNPSPALGEDIAIKFKLRNNLGVPMTLNAIGAVGRLDDPYVGANNDLGWVGPETFAAGEEKSYTAFVKTVSDAKKLYIWPAINYKGSYFHYNNWGFMLTPRLPNITFTTPLTVNNGNQFSAGQSYTVTTTIKNNEPKPLHYDAIGIPIRYYNTYNYDTGWRGPGTLAAAGQSGDSLQLSGTVYFDKHGPYTLWTSLNVLGRYITIGDQTTFNL